MRTHQGQGPTGGHWGMAAMPPACGEDAAFLPERLNPAAVTPLRSGLTGPRQGGGGGTGGELSALQHLGVFHPLTVHSPPAYPPAPPEASGPALCGTLARSPPTPPGAGKLGPRPGVLTAVPATHQNHKQTLLPGNATSPSILGLSHRTGATRRLLATALSPALSFLRR